MRKLILIIIVLAVLIGGFLNRFLNRFTTRTYYPIGVCMEPKNEACKVMNSQGEYHQRRRISLTPETFTVMLEQQDVIRKGGIRVESLTKDHGMECRVQSAENWYCARHAAPNEMYMMTDGDLNHCDEDCDPHAPVGIVYVPWCTWHWVDWHNGISDSDDDFTNRKAWMFSGLIFAVTGCAF